MANVRGQVSANTGNAKQEISQLSQALSDLHKQAKLFDGGGISLMGPQALKDLSGAVDVLTRAAGSFKDIDFGASNLPSQLTSALSQAQRNLDNYLHDLERKLPAHAKRIQAAVAGGSPLLPDWSQLTNSLSGLSGAQQHAGTMHAQSQMRDYYNHVFANIPWRNQMAFGTGGFGGGPTGGSVSDFVREHQSAADLERARVQHERTTRGSGGGVAEAAGNSLTVLGGMGGKGLAGLGKLGLFGLGLAGIGGAAAMSSQGYGIVRRDAETLDGMMRRFKDTGDQLHHFEEAVFAAGHAIGQTGEQAMETADTYARAAWSMDPNSVTSGYATSAGFARAYGLDPGQTGAQFGELRRFGVTGKTKSDEREFAATLAAAIQKGGYGGNAGILIQDVLSHVEQRAGYTGKASSEEAANYMALRTAMGGHDVLRGPQGAAVLSQLNAFAQSTGGLGTEMMWASALSRHGVRDPFSQRYLRESGITTDLGTRGGTKGVTVLQAQMDEAERLTKGLGNRDMGLSFLSRMTGLSMPMVEELFSLKEQHGASMFSGINTLGKNGVDIEKMDASGLRDWFNVSSMDAAGLADYAKGRMEGLSKDDKADLQRALDKAADGSEASVDNLRSILLKTIEQNGQQETLATRLRDMDVNVQSVMREIGKPIAEGVATGNEITEDIYDFMKETWGKATDGFSGEKDKYGLPIEYKTEQPQWLQKLRGKGAYAPAEYPISTSPGHQPPPTRSSGGFTDDSGTPVADALFGKKAQASVTPTPSSAASMPSTPAPINSGPSGYGSVPLGPTPASMSDPLPAASGGTAPAGPRGFNYRDLSGNAAAAKYNSGKKRSATNGAIIHHTAGHGSAEHYQRVFAETGNPTEWIIERDGTAVRMLPAGVRGQHMKYSTRKQVARDNNLSNSTTVGIEVVAHDDDDVLPEQVAGTEALLKHMGLYDKAWGHTEVNTGKNPHEGETIMKRVRAGRAQEAAKKKRAGTASGPGLSGVPITGASKTKEEIELAASAGGRSGKSGFSSLGVSPADYLKAPTASPTDEAYASASKSAGASKFSSLGVSAADYFSAPTKSPADEVYASASRSAQEAELAASIGSDWGVSYKEPKPDYVGNIAKFMETEGSKARRDASNFGNLNLVIDQRVNGISQRTDQQTLKGGSGTRQNEMYGVVDVSNVA